MVLHRFTFRRQIEIDDIADLLTLAILEVERLHGEANIRLDGWWRLDQQRRTCEIDASTEIGQDLASVFTGLVNREFGDNAFHTLGTKSRPRNGVGR